MVEEKNDPYIDNVCHLCGRHCDAHPSQIRDGNYYTDCLFTERLTLTDDIKTNDITEYDRRLNIILFDLMRRRRGDGNIIVYYYDASSKDGPTISDNEMFINVSYLLQEYPRWIKEVLQYSMINLYRLSQFKYRDMPGIDSGRFRDTLDRLLFVKDDDVSVETRLNQLVGVGYLHKVDEEYLFSKEGMDFIDDFVTKNELSSKVFIAMEFSDDDSIRECIKEVIIDCGYTPVIFTDYQHNSQIMPEIFAQIRESRFVIMETTVNNYGAYYEAGIARGLGKEVIIVCKDTTFHNEERTMRPHFDILQESMVIWKDLDDLKTRLNNRIRNTIGAKEPYYGNVHRWPVLQYGYH